MKRNLFFIPIFMLCVGTAALLWQYARGDKVLQHKFVGWDGGPLVVIQKEAISHWKGADEASQPNGDTDYDFACDCKANHLKRYHREMLVLDDGEWPARFVKESSDSLLIFQPYHASVKLPSSEQLEATQKPTRQFPFHLLDSSLRLCPGAVTGKETWGEFDNVNLEPGMKRARVYQMKDALIITLKTR